MATVILIYILFLCIIVLSVPAMLHFREAAKYRRLQLELKRAKQLMIAKGRTGRR